MNKILGILGLFVVICILTAAFGEHFLSPLNIENLIRRSALFGIISIGAAFVIITRGIDLSIGSVVCLVGCLTPWLLVNHDWPVWLTVAFVLSLGVCIGVLHGLLVTKLRIQPFIVTLCGLLLYRGITRGVTRDSTVGFGGEFKTLQAIGAGRIDIPFIEGFALPMSFVFLAVVVVLAGVFLNYTIYGRYLMAIGRNETAARFSGINTDRMILLAYVICGFLSGLGGLLFVLDIGSAQPVDFGNFYELYAIAAAVLGGCSLRGGEGAILGVVIGAAVMQVLRNAIVLIDWIPTNIEYAVIGAVLLLGVTADELVKRGIASRRARDPDL